MSDNDDKRQLPTRSHGTSVDLHNSGSLQAGRILESAVSNLTPEQRQNLLGKAAEEALRLEVKGREQQIDLAAGRNAAQDHLDAFATADKSGRLTRHKLTSDIKTGAGNIRIESKSGATCFVATAAYGDADHPDVAWLRDFRDTVLLANGYGRAFVAAYWIVGPRLASVVTQIPGLRPAARYVIAHLVRFLQRGVS